MPTAPPPPPLFTSAIGTGTSFSSTMILWTIRAIRSEPPPRPKGITNSTSLVGFQPCADTANGNAASSNRRMKKRIVSSSENVVVEANYTRPHGDAGRGRLARRAARHEVGRRRVRAAGKRLQGHGGEGRAGPISPLCFEKLPLGPPHADRARAEGPGEGGADLLRRARHVRERLGV